MNKQIHSKKDLKQYHSADTIDDLPDMVSDQAGLQEISQVKIPDAIKDPVTAQELTHRDFVSDAFWDKIPAFKGIDHATFMDVGFQNSNSATKVDHLDELLEDLVPRAFLDDIH